MHATCTSIHACSLFSCQDLKRNGYNLADRHSFLSLGLPTGRSISSHYSAKAMAPGRLSIPSANYDLYRSPSHPKKEHTYPPRPNLTQLWRPSSHSVWMSKKRPRGISYGDTRSQDFSFPSCPTILRPIAPTLLFCSGRKDAIAWYLGGLLAGRQEYCYM
ncbi:hypothetical protein SCHPADRAFT_9859 [Schizopora paradoxa]|uniref:Uncharacterized protein n=1 Tax=Schizopora paradoxa TaxID=27342 RepID=A0A0H2SFE6_9AGAM|nr:hypothetical protein SCHPADRAFT_9859 [Schizopora paradoxa]